MREWHTKILPRDEKIMEEWEKLPKIKFYYNCQSDCLIYEDGILVGKLKKDGKYIDYRKITPLNNKIK
jgi:hypothetical protein